MFLMLAWLRVILTRPGKTLMWIANSVHYVCRVLCIQNVNILLLNVLPSLSIQGL